MLNRSDMSDSFVLRDSTWEGAWESAAVVLLLMDSKPPSTPEDVHRSMEELIKQARANQEAYLKANEATLQRAIQHVKLTEKTIRHLKHLRRLDKVLIKSLRKQLQGE